MSSRRANDPQISTARISTPMLGSGAPPAADLFVADGLHLSPGGYAMWNAVVRDVLVRTIGH